MVAKEGDKFGDLTYICKTDERYKDAIRIHKFQCKCGNLVLKTMNGVKKLQNKMCNECFKKLPKKLKYALIPYDIIGKSKNAYKVISKIKRPRHTYLRVKCKCGHEKNVTYSQFLDIKAHNCNEKAEDCFNIRLNGQKRTTIQHYIDNEIYTLKQIAEMYSLPLSYLKKEFR